MKIRAPKFNWDTPDMGIADERVQALALKPPRCEEDVVRTVASHASRRWWRGPRPGLGSRFLAFLASLDPPAPNRARAGR